MNKFYFVTEANEGFYGVVVAAESAIQAKMWSTIDADYIDLRAKLLKGGQSFYDDDERTSGIKIVGDGAVETEHLGELEWGLFKRFLLDIGRGELFDDKDTEEEENE